MTGLRTFALSALAVLTATLVAAQPPQQQPQPLPQAPPQEPPPTAVQSAQRITPNFKDADITQIAEAVSAATGKTFIIDPRVRAQVTMLSSTPMSPSAFYETFLSILQVYGFIAVPAGNIVKILPDANARQIPGLDLPDHVSATSDEIVTQVLDVKNVSAAQLVPILRPMIPQYGHLVAYPAGNILIITDRASNVNRMMRIIRRIDQVGNQDPEIVPLTNASASEIVRVVNSLYAGAAASEGVPVKVVADERSNSILIAGDEAQRLRIRALIVHLDTPLEAGGDTRVRYLHYANAEKLAPKLKEQITGITQAAGGGAPGATGAGASPLAQAEKNAMVWADPVNNALIITAPPKIMRAVMDIVDKLDIRRPQVLVEAIIADIDFNKDSELGVNWAAFVNGSNVPAGAFVSPVGGTSIVDLAGAIQNPANATTTLLQGTTLGIGSVGGAGLNFAAMLRAIRADTADNIIATPSAVTMDNQEAELKVAQEVPFITGQFTNTTAVTGGTVNPFQTIQREEVGTILKITPTISAEGTQVMLKISIESSSIGTKPAGAVDLVTNKRTVSTTVLIDDGGIVVLGGLIEDDLSKSESRVPYLGNIPILGLLFKTRADTSTKNNLMIFIRPKILRDEAQAAYETGLKYNYMQDQQKPILNPHEALPLLPGVPPGKLPPLPPPPPPGTNPGINPGATSATPATQTPPAGAAAVKSPPAPAPANAPASAPAAATAPNGATATPGPAPENNAVPAAPPPAAGSSTPQGNP
jgi:general secretion pathway protein D